MYLNRSCIVPSNSHSDDRREARSELKLHADSPTAFNTVTAYGSGFIEINKVRHSRPVLVMPEQPVEPWDVKASTP